VYTLCSLSSHAHAALCLLLSSLQFLGVTSGVSTWVRSVHGSDQVAFKGEAVVDVHIARLIGAFKDAQLTLKWVQYLSELIEYPLKDPNTSLVYQKFDLPWPIRDRDVVLRRTLTFNKRTKTAIALYTSAEHPAHLAAPDVVRAEVRLLLY
jgi:hypothetical protein